MTTYSLAARKKMIALTVIVICLMVFPNPCNSQNMENLKLTVKPRSLSSDDASGNQSCPTWFVPSNGPSRPCVCGSTVGGILVKCQEDQNQSLLLVGFCMTRDNSTGVTVVGSCPFNYHQDHIQQVYVKLPKDVSQLNSFMCGGLNRTGQLCGKCEDGLGPSVFSYDLKCLECLPAGYGWLIYVLVAFVPTTLFFLVVVFFQLQATAAYMNAFVFLCQLITSMVNSDPYTFLNVPVPLNILELIVFTFYGFWNLDFFRYVIPSFCLSSNLSLLGTLSLEYTVAFYPLFLIFLTYIGVELHDRGFRPLVYTCRPLRACFKNRWDPKSSLIHAFATFLLLSYSKVLFVSYNLLGITNLFDNGGNHIGPTRFYYDASIPLFGREHLPFALLAIFVLFVFIVIPVIILLLYPTRVFQKCLGCCRVRWHPLHAFADAFQGCYKNGTNGTRDYRYFSGFYLIFRIVSLTEVAVTTYYIWMIIILCPITASLMFALLRPYKNDWFNILDSLLFATLALSTFLVMYNKHVASTPQQIVALLSIVPLIYIVSFVTLKLIKLCRSKGLCSFCRKYQHLQNQQPGQHELLASGEHDTGDSGVPDRLLHPEDYDHEYGAVRQ